VRIDRKTPLTAMESPFRFEVFGFVDDERLCGEARLLVV